MTSAVTYLPATYHFQDKAKQLLKNLKIFTRNPLDPSQNFGKYVMTENQNDETFRQ